MEKISTKEIKKGSVIGQIAAVCISENKGMRKKDVGSGVLIQEWGIQGDAHGGKWHRQVSLLAQESIDKMIAKGLDVGTGDFAENITTKGIELYTLPIGTRLWLGDECLTQVTQIGKECHNRCAIYEQAGDCVMPREGIFVRVITGGEIQNGQPIRDANDIITFAIIIASDKGSLGLREDKSGPAIREMMVDKRAVEIDCRIISDDRKKLAAAMRDLADNYTVDVIFVSGGTGFSPRDNTPEATLDIIDKQVPGIPEVMRAISMEITPKAMLSRAVAGIRGQTLIINLPGSPKAVKECLQAIWPALPHGVAILRGISGECASVSK
ncbi:MAG: molybdenum cofactor synthesis domain-containing protein [Bacillota bacterium]|jgi:molybdopterin adenylyltransferase